MNRCCGAKGGLATCAGALAVGVDHGLDLIEKAHEGEEGPLRKDSLVAHCSEVLEAGPEHVPGMPQGCDQLPPVQAHSLHQGALRRGWRVCKALLPRLCLECRVICCKRQAASVTAWQMLARA